MNAVNFRLDGRVAIVTGAGSGIGRRIATGLADVGADVGCLDVSGPAPDGGVRGSGKRDRRAIAPPADGNRADDLSNAVQRVEAELGPLRLAVNSAGIAN